MSTHNSTLASLWVDEGQSSPLKLQQPGPAASTNTTQVELKEDILKFYKDSGLEGAAKEAGILDPNGHLAALQEKAGPSQAPQAVQFVAVPMMRTPTKSTAGFSNVAPSPATSIHTPPSAGRSRVAPHIIATPVHNMQVSPVSSAKKRPGQTWTEIDVPDAKRRRGMKGEKGLRHFSMKVCEKVQRKGITTYNEVADELVHEFIGGNVANPAVHGYDQKNIRRRVYDALNVLMAMNIISKEKKEIRWIGLPANSAQEYQNLEAEKEERLERIRKKRMQLQELILQQIAFRNLVQRNGESEETQGPPQPNSSIQLPFIIVNTSKKTCIDCNISNDKHEYTFKFDNSFEIHDDIEVMKRMGLCLGLDKGSPEPQAQQKAEDLLPLPLRKYVSDMVKGHQAMTSSTTPSASHTSGSMKSFTQGIPDSGVSMGTRVPSRSLTTSSHRETPSSAYSEEDSEEEELETSFVDVNN